MSGFQTFADLTRIPLKRLTFLCGPNSAGKSAIEDALLIVQELYGKRAHEGVHEWADIPWARYVRLKNHWRRVNESPESFAETMQIGVKVCIPVSVSRTLAVKLADSDYVSCLTTECEAGSSKALPDYGKEIEIRTSFRRNKEFALNGPECEVALLYEGNMALEIVPHAYIGINLCNPMFSQVKLTSNWMGLAADYPSQIELSDSWIRIRSKTLTGRDRVNAGMLTTGWQHNIAQRLHDLVQGLVQIYNESYSLVLGHGFVPEMSAARASRAVPTDKELTFIFDSDSALDEDSLAEFGLDEPGNSEFRELAYSVADRRQNLHHKFCLTRDYPIDADTEDLSTSVDRALRDYLFIERGYRLDVKYRVVFIPDTVSNQIEYLDGPDYDWTKRHLIAKLVLADSQGRLFSFKDVGSGIGYMLPVLCVAYNKHLIGLIQQPELHLHPALQAGMTDVFIDATRNGKQLLIETHSEHVILRALKRIRQSYSLNPPNPDMGLLNSETSIVYFDPRPDGTTTVRHIRIGPDGEFLDRWPRGFFPERDQELFDE